jgi:hypothetical protein
MLASPLLPLKAIVVPVHAERFGVVGTARLGMSEKDGGPDRCAAPSANLVLVATTAQRSAAQSAAKETLELVEGFAGYQGRSP